MKIIKFCFIILTSYFILPTSYLHSQSGWGPDQRLVFLPGGGWDPRATCRGDTIHLVWYQRYGYHEVFYKRSTDAGWTWEADVRLSVEDTQTSALPQIAVSGNTVHVIWFEDDFGLLYRRSTDDGASWGNIDSIVPLGVHSSIDVFGDTVYICGITGSTGDLLFTKSIDNGNNWEPIQTITPAHDSPTLRNMLINALDIVISYEYTPEIYNVRSFDGGETWLDSQLVSEGIASGSQMPAMDPDDSSGIHIIWYDYKYSPYAWTGDIFYRASRDSGNTWEPIDSLTVMHRAVASDILTESNNLHLVWEDDRNDFGNNFEIYYRMSTDLGQTWGTEVRLTNALYKSICPSLACGGGYLHLFWRDCRDSLNNGIGFIYYKRKDLSGAISEFYHPKDISEFLTISPNPFRDKTLITFFLPDASGILEVYDASGRRVFKREVSGKGRKEVLWQINRAGVYFIRLKTINKTIIKKVVALR